MKSPKKDLTLMVWNDAQFDRDGSWKGPAVTFSVGYQLKEIKGCYRLAQSWSANQGYAEVLTIPVDMVIRSMDLGEVEPEEGEFADLISEPVMDAMKDALKARPE